MKNFIFVKSAVVATLVAAASISAPAQAVSPIPSCDVTLTNPDAVACAGYFSGNLLNNSAPDIAAQKSAIASLPGDFVFDGNWSAVEPFKITALSNVNQLNFGKTLFGTTIIGAHFGNVAGDAKNVSVFWLFDAGTEGREFVSLDNVQGFSNAVLYTTGMGAVPEPSTWAMMLLGFGAVGFSLRRRSKSIGRVQFA